MNKEEKREELKKLLFKMRKDEDLPLRDQANKLVFGEGNADAEIMMIGEGPGYHEDQQGLPFVGRAGGFLNRMLTLIKLDRKDVFITNVVHYRPPKNRDPFPEELEAFGEYLDKMIEIIDPTAIVTLGRFSMGKFLKNVKISNVHGKPKKVEWKGKELIVFPMYHPAAALRNGKIREMAIEDFNKLPKIIEENKKSENNSEQIGLI